MDILSAITDKDRLDFSQNINIARSYQGDSEFPDIKTQYLEAEYLRLTDSLQLPTAAMVHAFNTEAHIGTRPTAEKVSIEKVFIKEKINQSERVTLLKNRGVLEAQAILNYIFNDMGRMADNVKTRTEVAKQEVIATGKMTVNENGLNFTVDYGVPADNYFTLNWDDPDHDILGDIKGMVTCANNIGKNITHAKTSPEVIEKISNNTPIQKAIGGIYMQGITPALNQINALMMTRFGFTITVSNAMYAYENADGTKSSARYFDRNTFALYTVGANGAIGTGLWGPTPEEEAYGQWTEMSAKQFITITQWAEHDPVGTWTKASGLFIPVLPDPKGLFIAKVSSDVLAPLTVTSTAGSTTGTTHVTVSPALTSGNIYKYKTAANPTIPVFDQLISGGYTNWDGTSDITATSGQKIVIVEATANGHARKAGTATITVK